MIIILFMGPGWVSFAKAEKGGKVCLLGHGEGCWGAWSFGAMSGFYDWWGNYKCLGRGHRGIMVPHLTIWFTAQ